MKPTHFIILQLVLLSLIVLFGMCLLLGVVHIPLGVEGEWFTKIWETVLLVGNLAGLSLAVKYADDLMVKGDNNEKVNTTDNTAA